MNEAGDQRVFTIETPSIRAWQAKMLATNTLRVAGHMAADNFSNAQKVL